MKEFTRTIIGRGAARHRAAVASAVLFAFVPGASASAGNDESASGVSGVYAGVFAGSGRTANRIVDVEGFANWGNAGWTVDYDDTGFVGGVLAGKTFVIGGRRFRVEVDAMVGDQSATTNRVDPEGLDETAVSEIRWIATARVGVEESIGPVAVFATGGLSAARIVNSVTDIDFGPGMPDRVDPDDSFRDSETEFGWVIGAGLEVPLADAWTLRLDGSYLDFGRSTHYVNRSGGGRCGPGNPRKPCPYRVENRMSVVRLAIVRRFGE